MRPASHFDDLSIGAEKDPVVPSISIGLEKTSIAVQIRCRIIAGPAHREVVGAIGMLGVANVNPEATP
jgi:hypothetical protein